jgi:hypothetical protein
MTLRIRRLGQQRRTPARDLCPGTIFRVSELLAPDEEPAIYLVVQWPSGRLAGTVEYLNLRTGFRVGPEDRARLRSKPVTILEGELNLWPKEETK